MNQRLKAAATIQRIADSGLDIDTQDYQALTEIAAWLALIGQKPIVCLCGSTRFSQAFHEANLRETLEGRIVLSIGCDFKSDTDLLLAGELTPEDKGRLDELHLHKIDLADEVLILNVGGYTGQSTRREIAYAQELGKPIRWLEEEPPMSGGEMLQAIREDTDEHIPSLAEMIHLD